MQRRIIGYSVDEAGERIAILDCGHPQHIRHQPPFINRAWTLTEADRSAMLGQTLNCVRCDEVGCGDDDWCALALGDAMTADRRITEIEAAFRGVFVAAGQPPQMAVLKRHDTERSLHCEVTVYFSPAAAALARSFGAQPCARPLRSNLDLLAGDARCWAALFPEE
jgi:hypothetical protein